MRWSGVGAAAAVAVAAIAVVAGPPGGVASSTSVAAARCSRAAAIDVVERLRLGNAGYTPNPVAQVLCGPFLGPGSEAMVASLSIPSCGRTGGWVVFRRTATDWQPILARNNGAELAGVGSGIRETMWVLRPGDAHCFPSGGTRSRVWRWNGARFTATAWRYSRQAAFLSPTRNLFCEMSGTAVYCQSVARPHSVRMGVDGRATVCVGAACLRTPPAGTPVLAYDREMSLGRFRCLSQSSGIACTVADSGRGFLIDRDGINRVGP